LPVHLTTAGETPALPTFLGRVSFSFDWLPSGLSLTLRQAQSVVSLSNYRVEDRTVSLPNPQLAQSVRRLWKLVLLGEQATGQAAV